MACALRPRGKKGAGWLRRRIAPVGFMGRNGGHVDMLFVDPAFFGCGAGRTLLRLAWERAFAAGLPLTLDVNEQNPGSSGLLPPDGFCGHRPFARGQRGASLSSAAYGCGQRLRPPVGRAMLSFFQSCGSCRRSSAALTASARPPREVSL